MPLIRGVDGCKAGWICLSVQAGGTRPYAVVYTDGEHGSATWQLFQEQASVTAIDIPIGLPSSRTRRVDESARRLLGSLKSSVFPAPMRVTLSASSYEEACEASHSKCGKKLSKQTFGILARIRDVDAALRQSTDLAKSVYEIHPEVCFVYWNFKKPLLCPKKSGWGFIERLELVRQVFGDAPEQVRATIPRSEAADDDILDAFAALWTAQRIYDRSAARVAETDDHDDCGLTMQIWA